MSLGSVPVLQARTLYLDGDGLAYYCAGNDDTLLGEARQRTADKVKGMQAAVAASSAHILLTDSGSHKGHRYAVARVKPYQEGRKNSRRPKNWRGLRDMLIGGTFGDKTMATATAEADDLFGYNGHSDPENTVIATQDKDMRMVPGWHANWVTNMLCYLAPGTYDFKFNDLQYGNKWFWLQMLHGDTADSIPGLPWVKIAGKLKRVGDVTACELLAGTASDADALIAVRAAYASYYGKRALVEMMEQAVLLWMRRDAESNWTDAFQVGGPLHACTNWPEWHDAFGEIQDRVTTAESYAAIEGK